LTENEIRPAASLTTSWTSLSKRSNDGGLDDFTCVVTVTTVTTEAKDSRPLTSRHVPSAERSPRASASEARLTDETTQSRHTAGDLQQSGTRADPLQATFPDIEPKDERGSDILSAADCYRLLEGAAGGVGHLGLFLDGHIAVLPFNYRCYEGDVIVCLGPGSTLEALLSSPEVGFEVDHVDGNETWAPGAWSVLAHGTAGVVREPLEIGEASALGLTPLVSDAGHVYVRIRIEAISGRSFTVAALARGSLAPPAQ
jgi:hypothetical protein